MDEVDHAKILEQQHRAIALAAALKRPEEEEPLVVDGVVCCLDCQEPIPPERLAVRPESVRCVECKGRKERFG